MLSMPIRLKLKIEDGFIRADFKGRRTEGKELQETKNAWIEVAQACRENNVFKILAIMQVEGKLPFDAAYKLARSVSEIGFTRDHKLAVIASKARILLNIRFSETIFRNRGYEVRIFKSERPAKKWLLDE